MKVGVKTAPMLSRRVNGQVEPTNNDSLFHSVRRQQIRYHQQMKQILLNKFADELKKNATNTTLQAELNNIKLARCGGHQDHPMAELLKNGGHSYLERECPKSAALALIAFTVKIFGNKLIKLEKGLKLKKNAFWMAFHILFGKNIYSIRRDINFVLSKLNITQLQDNQDTYTLAIDSYTLSVDIDNKIDTNEFVKVENINQDFFHAIRKMQLETLFSLKKIPEILNEITGKNFQRNPRRKIKNRKKQTRAEYIKKLAEEMTVKAKDGSHNSPQESERSLYNNQVRSGEETHILTAKFLTDSAPSAMKGLNNKSLRLLPEEIKSRPINAWKATIEVKQKKNNVELTTSSTSLNLTASQQTEEAARTIIHVLQKKGENQTIFIDLRFLTGIPKMICRGSERRVFKKHREVMRKAVNDFNGQEKNKKRKISYYPLHCEAHSHRDVAFAKSCAPLVAPLSPLFMPIADMVTEVYKPPSFTPFSEKEKLVKKITALFTKLNEEYQEKYRSVFELWKKLLWELHHERHAIPFTTLTTILTDALNENNTGETITLIMGCKSAKDRTTAVVAGVQILQALLMGELKKDKPNISRFFDREGYVNPHNLTPEEKLLIQDLYDVRLFHVANKYNTGLASNISSDIMTDSTFKRIPFIRRSKIKTVILSS